MIIGIPFLLFACGLMLHHLSVDSEYAKMLAERDETRYGFMLLLPRPVLFALMAAFEVLIVVFGVKLVWAAMQNQLAFTIDAQGIRSYPLLWQQPKALGWGQIRKAWRYKGNCNIVGQGFDGRKVRVTFSLSGHNKKTVLAAIAAYRPDIAQSLN